MSKPSRAKLPRRANYRRKLAHVVVLGDGTKLVTLRDATNVLPEVFGSVNARSGALDRSTRLLLAAAESGGKQNISDGPDTGDSRTGELGSFGQRYSVFSGVKLIHMPFQLR
jgi:hypothetical protein